ncbi:hypothetical protein ACH5RR_003673 [Cinchona calisaya]|uniref:Uncharacterized protein n=1 Tax=Cinchona calisaya TaxID=153742 RepID=A0ABD3AW72_9GENT
MEGVEIDVEFTSQLQHVISKVATQIDDNYAEYIIGVTVEEVANMATQSTITCDNIIACLPIQPPAELSPIETSRETFSQGTDLVDALMMPSSIPSLPTLPRKKIHQLILQKAIAQDPSKSAGKRSITAKAHTQHKYYKVD